MDKAEEKLERVWIEADERVNNVLLEQKGAENDMDMIRASTLKKEFEVQLKDEQDRY